eukprot:4260137-Pyramimonas_sp.AAC.1
MVVQSGAGSFASYSRDPAVPALPRRKTSGGRPVWNDLAVESPPIVQARAVHAASEIQTGVVTT